ncbi:MAG: Hpt domain-containing protein [Sphaerochaetaceae bacterium]|nr:Hpt domain-containing protein [Sphaerochaetaceae bacterium]
MDKIRLVEKLIVYGADMRGVHDRFMGDSALYEKCFLGFLKEPNFDALERSMDAGDYVQAFEAAHALKGLSGNLGLIPFYDVLCKLVESLRMKALQNVEAEYADVVSAFHLLEAIVAPDASDAGDGVAHAVDDSGVAVSNGNAGIAQVREE